MRDFIVSFRIRHQGAWWVIKPYNQSVRTHRYLIKCSSDVGWGSLALQDISTFYQYYYLESNFFNIYVTLQVSSVYFNVF